MAQTLHDVLFAHWSVNVEALRLHVPEALPIDTLKGEAWIGILAFRVTGIRPRLLPPLPWLSAFGQLNVRTYVTRGEKPGVFFLSVDAASSLVVAGARRLFGLPFYRARMMLARNGEQVRFSSRRTQAGAPPAELEVRYAPAGEVRRAAPGSLDHWLIERYCSYSVDRHGKVSRMDIDHAPWPLQPAEAEVAANTMTRPLGLTLPKAPLLHFARRIDLVAWRPRPLPAGER